MSKKSGIIEKGIQQKADNRKFQSNTETEEGPETKRNKSGTQETQENQGTGTGAQEHRSQLD